MNYCLQKHTTDQFTYFIYYLFQDKFKNPKIIKNPTCTAKAIHRTSLNFWNNLLLHHIAFEFKATQEM